MLAAALVVASGGLALRAMSAAEDYFPSINLAVPPLGAVETPVAPAPPRLSRRVVLVLIDGLRLDRSFGHPALDHLRRVGVDAAARSHYPTISRPNHVTLVTGVPPRQSGVRNNFYDWPVTIDSLMDRAAAAGLPSAYVADVAAGVTTMFSTDFEDMHWAVWPGGLLQASLLTLRRDYPLVVIIPGAVDTAGHRHGADSEEYRAAVAEVDEVLGAVVGALDLERDTIIVTSDHGHTDSGGHGGTEPSVTEIPLVMAGAGIRPGATLGERALADVAPTAAALLGLPAPRHALGRTMTGALAISPEAAARLQAADDARIARIDAALERTRAEAGTRMAKERLGRLALVGIAVVVALIGIVAVRRLGAVHIDWRVLAIAVPTFPLTYYALIDLLAQRLSLSGFPDRGEVLSRLFHFGLVSTAVYVIAGWMALRGRVILRDRLAAANAMVLCGTAVAWLPAAVLWALFDAGPHIEVPPSRILVLVPATYVAVATYAIGVTVLLGLEIVVFFARAVDPRLRLRRLERAAERQRERIARGP